MSKEKSKWLAQGVEYYPESGTLLLIRCPECGNRFWAREPDDGWQLLPVCPKCGTAIIKS